MQSSVDGDRDPSVATGASAAGASSRSAKVRPVGRVRRVCLAGLGLLCVAIGGIGIVVPGLPTTVFFILAAACFAKSSPRLEQWVLDLPRIGPMVSDYRSGLGMPRRAKQWAIGSIVVFSAFAIIVVDNTVVRIVVAAVAAIGVWFVGWRVPTRETVIAARTSA